MNPALWLVAAVLGVGPVPPQAVPSTASGPCASAEARRFDFWIGEWDIRNRQRSPARLEDPTFHSTGSARLKVHPILGGCAVVEHWQGDLSWGRVHGFSVRAYDPRRHEWVLVLNWPLPRNPEPVFQVLTGVFEHGRGEFFRDGHSPDGKPLRFRYTFSDVTRRGYRWDGAVSRDGGASWSPTWIMEATRRDATTADPVLAGPALEGDDPPLCARPEARAFDPFLGEWKDLERGDHVRFVSILDGCAVVERAAFAGEPPLETFRVRAFDPKAGEWVQYGLDDQDPVFEKLAGGPAEGGIVLTGQAEAGGSRIRETWLHPAPSQIVFERALSDDQGAHWKTVRKLELTRVR